VRVRRPVLWLPLLLVLVLLLLLLHTEHFRVNLALG
jgi:hypothetical protein